MHNRFKQCLNKPGRERWRNLCYATYMARALDKEHKCLAHLEVSGSGVQGVALHHLVRKETANKGEACIAGLEAPAGGGCHLPFCQDNRRRANKA